MRLLKRRVINFLQRSSQWINLRPKSGISSGLHKGLSRARRGGRGAPRGGLRPPPGPGPSSPGAARLTPPPAGDGHGGAAALKETGMAGPGAAPPRLALALAALAAFVAVKYYRDAEATRQQVTGRVRGGGEKKGGGGEAVLRPRCPSRREG